MSLGGGGGTRSVKGGAQGGRDHQRFGPGGDEIPRDLAPGGRDHGGAKSLGHRKHKYALLISCLAIKKAI